MRIVSFEGGLLHLKGQARNFIRRHIWEWGVKVDGETVLMLLPAYSRRVERQLSISEVGSSYDFFSCSCSRIIRNIAGSFRILIGRNFRQH